MGISGIGSQGENPFLKKMHDDISGLGYKPHVNSDENNITVKPGDDTKIDKTQTPSKIDENQSAQAGSSGAGQQLLDKTQFTNENDVQEIDPEQFEDDM